MAGANFYQAFNLQQMCSGNVCDSLNVMFNAGCTHLSVMPMFYSVPLINFNNMSPYADSYSMGFPNPLATIHPKYFDTNGNFVAPWLDPNNMGMMPTGYPGIGIGGGSGVSNGSADTPEMKEYQRKYNKLMNLMKTLYNAENIPSHNKDLIQDKCISTTVPGKDYKEQYENLKKIYEEVKEKIGKEEIKRALVNANGLGAYAEYKQADKNSIREKLTESGYEFSTDTIDERLNGIKSGIENLSDDKSNPMAFLGEINNVDILDFVSSWNTKFNNDTNAKGKFIQLLVNKYNDEKIDNKEKIQECINQISNKLVTKAKDLKDNRHLSNDFKTRLSDAINNVEKNLNKNVGNNTKDYSGLNYEFNKLYVLTRLASIAVLRNNINEYYGFIDSAVFDNDLFADATKEDLIAEGFEDELDSLNGVKINNDVEIENNNGNKPETVQEKVNDLVGKDVLSKGDNTTISGVEYQVYKCDLINKNYVIKEGKIYELNNNVIGTAVIKIEDIKDEYDAKKAENDKNDEKNKLKSNYINKKDENITIGQKSYTPEVLGSKIEDCYGWINDWSDFMFYINLISEQNVLNVMKGYIGKDNNAFVQDYYNKRGCLGTANEKRTNYDNEVKLVLNKIASAVDKEIKYAELTGKGLNAEDIKKYKDSLNEFNKLIKDPNFDFKDVSKITKIDTLIISFVSKFADIKY